MLVLVKTTMAVKSDLPSLSEMINSRESTRKMIRLLICRCDCHPEADILCRGRHGRYDS